MVNWQGTHYWRCGELIYSCVNVYVLKQMIDEEHTKEALGKSQNKF